VIRMWRNGVNERGERLTAFEQDAPVERHCELFVSSPHEETHGDRKATHQSSAPTQRRPFKPRRRRANHCPKIRRFRSICRSTSAFVASEFP
jgi:hypothetical protein